MRITTEELSDMKEFGVILQTKLTHLTAEDRKWYLGRSCGKTDLFVVMLLNYALNSWQQNPDGTTSGKINYLTPKQLLDVYGKLKEYAVKVGGVTLKPKPAPEPPPEPPTLMAFSFSPMFADDNYNDFLTVKNASTGAIIATLDASVEEHLVAAPKDASIILEMTSLTGYVYEVGIGGLGSMVLPAGIPFDFTGILNPPLGEMVFNIQRKPLLTISTVVGGVETVQREYWTAADFNPSTEVFNIPAEAEEVRYDGNIDDLVEALWDQMTRIELWDSIEVLATVTQNSGGWNLPDAVPGSTPPYHLEISLVTV